MRSGENDGVFAGACRYRGGEGTSNGDGVAAVTAIDRDSGVPVVCLGVIVTEMVSLPRPPMAVADVRPFKVYIASNIQVVVAISAIEISRLR